jgi:hypothetical protein
MAAMRRLRRLHPEEFEEFMREECIRRGVPRYLPKMPPEESFR